uniref:Cystic fibrosis transmembrane conductance regulator-like n=1 Tax=Saccoglossus kowalevskii TaxID=10224 RepID=A0ABM0MIL0_SACKO|nr:PREDICTED: cystic fibrosis transmembrane conductance regulator-like [Saccoglossus kowalevskii]
MTAKSWLSMHIHTLSLIYLGIFTAYAYSNHSQFTAVEIVIILVTFWSTVGSYTEFLYTVATLEREHSSVDKCLEFAGTNVRENIIAVHTEKKLGSQLLFTDINFERGGSKLLSNVNFCISEGEKIGILGLSDKSKDALVDILMKITNPTKGTVSIDGVDMSKLHSQSVRRAITHIPTKTALFSTTLRNNLDPSHNYSNTEIWKVLNQVGLKSRIESTPNQLNCDVYRDLKLQAGELSLVSFIRGILKKSPIVIIEDLPLLGEDSARERQLLLQMINKKFCTATKLILTNKPNADLLIDCQRILQVRDGTFHELGK